jgi:DNA invertase Pin-like site-specific DNA recombinase
MRAIPHSSVQRIETASQFLLGQVRRFQVCGQGQSAEYACHPTPLGRAIVVIIGAVAELERNLIIERVRAGMRRARLEGRHIGRNRLELDHGPIQRDRCQGQSLRQIAKGHRVSTATIQRVLRLQNSTAQENVA